MEFRAGWVKKAIICMGCIVFLSTGSAYAGNFTSSVGATTASAINTGRGAIATTDVVTLDTLAAPITMDAAIDLSGGGGIVVDTIAASILDGASALSATNVTINGAAGSLTNSNATSATTITNLILNAGTFTNNAALTGAISSLTLSADGSKIDGTAAVTVTSTATLNFNLELDGNGVKTFTNGISISAGKTLTVTGTGAHVLGATALSGTLTNNDANLAAISSLDVAADTAKIDGTGATTVTAQVVVDNNLEIDGTGVKTFTNGVDINAGKTLTVTGTGVHVLGATSLSGTLTNNDANLAAISSVDVAADTAKIDGTGATTVTAAVAVDNNLELDGTGVKTFTNGIDINAGKTLTVTGTGAHVLGATSLSGTLTNNDANLAAIASVDVAADTAVIGGTGATTITNAVAVDNNLSLTGTGVKTFAGAVTFSGTKTMTISKDTRVVSGGGIDTTGGGKISIDLGTGTTGSRVSGDLFSQVNGAVTVTAAAGGTLSDLVATGGVSGVSYEVFTTALTNGVVDDLLSTNSSTLTYKLVNDGTSGILGNVLVSASSASAFSSASSRAGSSNVTGGVSRTLDIINADSSTYNSEIQALMSQLGDLSGAGSVSRAMVELSGTDMQGSVAQSTLNGISQSSGALRNQMVSFRSGNLSAGLASSFSSGGATAAVDEMADADTLAVAYETAENGGTYRNSRGLEGFVKAYGGFGEQGSDDEYTGFSFYNAGVLVGLNYSLSNDFRLGGYVGYSHNYAEIYQNLGYGIDDTIRFGAYGSYQYDNLFVDLSPSVGIHILETKRYLTSVINARATGERTGVDFNMQSTIGYRFDLPYEVTLTPSYSLGYTIMHDPKYTETGAAGANLIVDSNNTNSLLQNVQLNLSKIFVVNDRVSFLPEVWGGWELEYLNTGGNLRSSFTGATNNSFDNRIKGTDTNRGYFGLGATALIDDNISVFGRYDHKIWKSGYNASFTLGVKVGF